jgi:hypothetical protein
MFWLIGSFSNDLNETSFLAAIINSIGSVGSTFGFVVSAENFDYNGACAINLALFFVSLPGLAWVTFNKVNETTHGTHLSHDALFNQSAIEHGLEGSTGANSVAEKGSFVPSTTEKAFAL